MNRDTLVRLGRRTLVAAATIAVLGVAVGTIGLAAQWRAEAAPLDVAPAGMTTVGDEYAMELERTDDLTSQLDGVAGQISNLQAALITANGSIGTDAANAAALQAQLDAAKAKLTSIQKQLKAAQTRLEQLNRAAARQAASNRQSASSGGGGGDHEDEDDDHEDDDDD